LRYYQLWHLDSLVYEEGHFDQLSLTRFIEKLLFLIASSAFSLKQRRAPLIVAQNSSGESKGNRAHYSGLIPSD